MTEEQKDNPYRAPQSADSNVPRSEPVPYYTANEVANDKLATIIARFARVIAKTHRIGVNSSGLQFSAPSWKDDQMPEGAYIEFKVAPPKKNHINKIYHISSSIKDHMARIMRSHKINGESGVWGDDREGVIKVGIQPFLNVDTQKFEEIVTQLEKRYRNGRLAKLGVGIGSTAAFVDGYGRITSPDSVNDFITSEEILLGAAVTAGLAIDETIKQTGAFKQRMRKEDWREFVTSTAEKLNSHRR